MSGTGNMNLQLTLTGTDRDLSAALSRGERNVASFGRTTENALNQAAAAGRRLQQALGGFSTGGKLAAAAGTILTLREGVAGMVELEAAMLGVKANIMSSAGSAEDLVKQLQAVRATARDLSKQTMFSDADLVTMTGQLLKSGVKLQDIGGKNGAAFATASLAQLGGLPPEQAAAQLGSLGNAFSFKSPQQYGDLANQISRVDDASAMSTGKLLYNSQLVSASAAQLKIDPKRMISALGYLDPLGDMAGTSLNRLLEGLAGTTKGKRAALKKSGMNFWHKNADGTETMNDFGDVIETIRTKFRGMKSDRQKLQLGHQLFGEEGGRAASFFASKDTSFRDFEAQVAKSSTAAAKLEVQMTGVGAAFERLKHTVFSQFDDRNSPLRDAAKWGINKVDAGVEAGHGGVMAAGALAAVLAAKLGLRALTGPGASKLASAAGALGVEKVWVMNWPRELGGSPIPGKGKFGAPTASEMAGTASKGGAALALGVGAAMVAAPIVLGIASKYALESDTGLQGRANAKGREALGLEARMREEKANNADPKELQKLQARHDEAINDMKGLMVKLLESTNRPVQVIVDGRVIATAVNRANGQEGKRN